MTPGTHYAAGDDSLSAASLRMRQAGIRNLPVVDDGKVCGVLTERDVTLAESLPSLELAQLSVRAAMGRDLYPVAASAPLAHVVRTMAAHGYCCAVVTDFGSVVGVFSASDALRILSTELDALAGEQDAMRASDARAIMLTEHAHLDALVSRTQKTVRARGGRRSEHEAGRVREQALHLRDALHGYLELAERQLELVFSDLLGSSEAVGQQVAEAHSRLRADCTAFNAILEQPDSSPLTLAEQVEHLLPSIDHHLRHTHGLLMALEEVSNDSVITDAGAD